MTDFQMYKLGEKEDQFKKELKELLTKWSAEIRLIDFSTMDGPEFAIVINLPIKYSSNWLDGEQALSIMFKDHILPTDL